MAAAAYSGSRLQPVLGVRGASGVVLPPLQHELVAAADSLAVVLPALQHELVPAHDSGCWPTAGADSTLASARPLPATTRQPSGRPGPPALQLAPSRAERAKGDGGLRRAAGAVLCRASCAPPSRRTLTTGTTASSVLQAAAGSVGLLAGAPSRRLPDRARLPACLLPVTVLAGVGRPAARQSAISTAIAEPASPLLDDPALRPRPS